MSIAESSIFYHEIVCRDFEQVSKQYSQLVGIEFVKVAELGNALVATLPKGGRLGIRAPMSSSEEPLTRLYIQVDDLGASVTQVAKLGANILLERMEIPGQGIIAIYEQGGIEHGLWQVS